jgi:hypothetical protein
MRLFYLIICLKLIIFYDVIAQTDSLDTQQEKKKISLKYPDDGAIDMSDLLKSHTGIMPVPIIVTEPAVGYGGGAAILYFHPRKKKVDRTKVAPNITGIAGLGTQNKTWMAGAFHFHVFGEDKVRSLTAFAKPNVRIKYYGNNNEFLEQNPVKLNLDAWVAVQRVEVRLAKSNWFAGGSYIFFTTENSLDTIPGRPLINALLERLSGTSTISSIEPFVKFDNRDNLFTPTKGFNAGFKFLYNATWLGADDNYTMAKPYMLAYVPIVKKLYSAYRFDGNFVVGDAPLYALPFIQLRGIPAMRYQSDNTLVAETEWRYQFYKRWSVLAFTGLGKAFKDFETFGDINWAYNYGTGIRYEIARDFGIHSGLDFAWGDGNDFAFYIVFGTSWHN